MLAFGSKLIPPSDKAGRRPREQGFTLLEILVAVAVLGLAYLAVLQNFSFSMRNIDRVDTAGIRDFEAISALERQLTIIPSGRALDPLTGEVFVSGTKFQLVLADDPDHPQVLACLLERKP